MKFIDTIVNLNEKIETAAEFVKDEIDLRIDSLKNELDEIRQEAFERIDEEKDEIYK